MSPGELICPAGTPAALRTAVDAGADAVYCGFQNATNARNFPGLNFTPDELASAVAYAHSKAAKVLLALNTYPPRGRWICGGRRPILAHGWVLMPSLSPTWGWPIILHVHIQI